MKTVATTIILFFAISTFAQQLDVDGDVDVNNHNITNLADPTNPQDAVTKTYVDLLEKRIADLEFEVSVISGTGVVSDMEGNDYKVAKIGSQYWTTENLRTTKYHDGTSIPLVVDSFGVGGWTTISTPAYCWPSNDPDSLGFAYGALYNHYAVSDTSTRNVCPVGWHVPSDQEWTVLSTYLTNNGFGFGGSGSDIGKALASKYLWYPPDAVTGNVGNDPDSNNSSNFDGRPGGHRESVGGQFLEYGASGYWWTKSASSTTHGYFRELMSSSGDLNRNFRNRKNGFSVRCVRD